MKFFIDTANIDEIKEVHSWGVIDGVTTNPTLVAKEGRDFKQVVQEICSIVDGPVSAEVVSLKADEMVEEARDIASWAPNVVIKVPMTDEGLKATYRLKQESIKVNMTLIFSPSQALMAAKAGAAFVSPFIGRLDDISHEGMDLVADIAQIFDIYGIETEIIAASVRGPRHVVEAAKAGAHIATIPYKAFQQMLKHPLTDIGIERFLSDWEQAKKG